MSTAPILYTDISKHPDRNTTGHLLFSPDLYNIATGAYGLAQASTTNPAPTTVISPASGNPFFTTGTTLDPNLHPIIRYPSNSSKQFYYIYQGPTKDNGTGTWTLSPSFQAAWGPITYTHIDDIAWNGSVYCAIGGSIPITSPDGINWTARSFGITYSPSRLIWTGTQFMALDDGGKILTSPDGITWIAQNSASASLQAAIATATGANVAAFDWSGGNLMCVGADDGGSPGSNQGLVAISHDGGVTWSNAPQFNHAGMNSNGLMWCGSFFAASRSNLLYTWSPTGVLTVWTQNTAFSSVWLSTDHITAMGFNGTTMVMMGTGATGPGCCSSNDGGVTWTAHPAFATINSSSGPFMIKWSQGVWLVTGANGKLLTSPDLNTWTSNSSLAAIYATNLHTEAICVEGPKNLIGGYYGIGAYNG